MAFRLPAIWTLAAAITAAGASLPGMPLPTLASEVLRTLISSPPGQALPPYRWRVTISGDRHLNAASSGDGEIFVTGGLADVLGQDRGLWAAVLSHEIAHVIILPQDEAYRPGFEKKLEELYQNRGTDRDPRARSILHLDPAGGERGPLALARRREYQADRVGMLLMAAAGFHPDYAIAFDRRIRFYVRDQPRLGRFLLTHPRWEDREAQNADTARVALAIFRARWPNAAESPGGNAPPLGLIEAVKAAVDPRGENLSLRIPVRFRNAVGARLRIAVNFHGGGKIVGTAWPAFRASDGSLALYASLPDSPGGATVVAFQVPLAAFDTSARRLKAVVFIMAGEQPLGIYIQPIDRRPPG
jgi:hypothetical protein